MEQQPITWTNSILRKYRFFLRCRGMDPKEKMQDETLPRRLHMEPKGMKKPKTHLKIPPVKENKSPRSFPTTRLVHIPNKKERRGITPRAMTLNNLINPSHPLLMEK
jgi:hypothetical protein